MTLLERIDARIDKEHPLVLHMTSEMCQRLVREDIGRWQEGATDFRFALDYDTGEQFYRSIPIKIVGTGLKLE